MPTERQWNAARARAQLNAALRSFFAARGFLEVETPALVPAPGQEPHITPFTVPFAPETDRGRPKTLYLHTSPEYAMKRLLAEPGCPPLFQLCKVFRNGEVSQTHNPEFTLLEFYRPNADYHALMDDTEALMLALQDALGMKRPFTAPFERLPVKEAVRSSSSMRETLISEIQSSMNSCAGNSSTSAICASPNSSISTRSMPIAMPVAGGIFPTAARNRSSSGGTSRPSRRRNPCSSTSRLRCSTASLSSEKPFASSKPPA